MVKLCWCIQLFNRICISLQRLKNDLSFNVWCAGHGPAVTHPSTGPARSLGQRDLGDRMEPDTYHTLNAVDSLIYWFLNFLQKNLMWNTVTVQYNPLIEEEFDEHFKVTCEYGYDFWKTVTFPFLDVEWVYTFWTRLKIYTAYLPWGKTKSTKF